MQAVTYWIPREYCKGINMLPYRFMQALSYASRLKFHSLESHNVKLCSYFVNVCVCACIIVRLVHSIAAYYIMYPEKERERQVYMVYTRVMDTLTVYTKFYSEISHNNSSFGVF